MKTPAHDPFRIRGFTLVELLVVMTIVAILAATSMAVYSHITGQMTHRKAVITAVQLKHSIKLYINEYSGRLPIAPEDHGGDAEIKSDAELMKALLALDPDANPRQLIFGEFRRAGKSGVHGLLASHDFVDPWGRQYCVLLNGDGDNQMENPDTEDPGGVLVGEVEVFSAGADGDPKTWEDNAKTW